jgi:hypothetical protein
LLPPLPQLRNHHRPSAGELSRVATNPIELSKRFHRLPGLTGRRGLPDEVTSNVSGILLN